MDDVMYRPWITDIKERAMDDDEKEEMPPNTKMYEGVVATDILARDWARLDKKSLDNFVRKLNQKDTPVLKEHGFSDDPLGRAISGRLEEGKVIARFYIHEDTDEGADTIRLLDAGTLNKLSAGWIDYTESCDECGEMMEGRYFKECKNGHFPGQRKADKERVTTTIHDAELIEFSIVTIPSDPNADILSTMRSYQEAGTLTDDMLDFVDSRYPSQVSIRSLLKDDKTPPKIGDYMMDDRKREELVDEILKKDAQIAELEARPTEEDVEKRMREYTERNAELETDVAAKIAEVEAFTRMSEDHTKALVWLRKKTLDAWVAKEGILIRNNNDVHYKTKAESIENTDSIYSLLLDYVVYQTEASKRREGGQRSIGTLTVGDLNADKPQKGYRL